MKRAFILMLPAGMFFGLWQWHRLYQLDQRRSELDAQIAEAKSVLALKKKGSAVAGKAGTPDAASSAAAVPEVTPLEVDEFFELAGEISNMEAGTTAGQDRKQLREKITALFARLPVTPVAQLKTIMDKLASADVSADGKAQISTAIMNLLAESDPASAAAYALQHKAKPGTLEVAMRSWAKQDAGAAAAWLEQAGAAGSLPPGLKVEQLRLILLPHLIAADPGGAVVDQIAGLQPGDLGDLLAETARFLTAAEQRRAFLDRLTSMPGLPTDAVSQFLHLVGREASIEAAAALLNELGPALPPTQFDTAAVGIATSRIDASTPENAKWLLQNLRNPDREPAIAKLIQAWTQADYNAAAAWLQQQPPSTDRDVAAAAFAQVVAAKEPPSAVDWAATIADPARKAAVLASLYRDWYAHAPQEAAVYFQKKGLTLP